MSAYLQSVKAGHYGSLDNCTLGPLGPGLNVVYGPNEAGKSTYASLVGGVLFGWEDAHGVRNTYRPEGGERDGELAWLVEEVVGARVSRMQRDEEGARGDMLALEDIDRDTYEAIFSLTSDELRSLGTSSDVTARMLTAGAGTMSSPSTAFVNVEQRIAALTAPATGQAGTLSADAHTESVFQLEAQLECKREQMREAAARAELHKQESREMHELEATRANTAERIEALNGEIEELVGLRAELSAVDEQRERYRAELKRLDDERERLALSHVTQTAGRLDGRLLELDSATDRRLTDRLGELVEQREKIGRMVDAAKENSATSTAAYEALCEIDEDKVAQSRKLRNRPWQAIISVVLPLAFIVAGVPLFVHGRQINSLSITTLAIGLVVASVFLAAAAFVMLFRTPKGAEALEDRRSDAQWVMLQDRKKLDARLAEQAQLEREISTFLDNAGLGAADGSIRQAYGLLDEARAARSARAEDVQRETALDMRVAAAERSLTELQETRGRIEASLAGYGIEAGHVDAAIRERSTQRDALLEASDDMNQRYGELGSELQSARYDRSFDQLKLEYQVVHTRLRETKHELMVLLLAKRILDRSIAAWERQSQPEVYDRAGKLLSLITDGRWVRVSASTTGSLVAINAQGVERDPRHLSLGTCQQLYLALRIALLMTACNVGSWIPVIADDILVNFDSARQLGAARALAQLASTRQVVVFTSHESTVDALCAAGCPVTRINL